MVEVSPWGTRIALQPSPLADALGGAHGEGAVDLDRPVTPRPDITATSLATAAAVAHDAHIVKYTLACLDAADADPSQRDLYFAAADHLHQWWAQRGDPSDPLGHTAPT